jgi:hypothetical protein
MREEHMMKRNHRLHQRALLRASVVFLCILLLAYAPLPAPITPARAAVCAPLDAGDWTQQARLTASDGAAWDNLGWSAAVSGDIAVVGAAGDDARKGSVYIFIRPGPGWTDMTQTAKLTASDGAAGHRFGVSVALSGDTIVVGASGGSGAAYVFQKPAGGWADMTQTAKLTASDGAADDQFGWSVAISGDTVVVGADLYDVSGNNGNFDQGAAYVFVKPGAGWTDMTQTARLTAGDGGTENYFGASVSISGDTVVVGAEGAVFPGAAYLFVKPGAGWTNMTQTAKLTAGDGAASDQFGHAVGVAGNTIVVGAYGDDGDKGSAYIMQAEGGPERRIFLPLVLR